MLNHTGSVVLETDRLILRKFQLNDAENMFINWAASPEVTRYVTWFPHSSVELSRNVIEAWIDEYQEPDYYQWAIVVKDINRKIVGYITNNVYVTSREMKHIAKEIVLDSSVSELLDFNKSYLHLVDTVVLSNYLQFLVYS